MPETQTTKKRVELTVTVSKQIPTAGAGLAVHLAGVVKVPSSPGQSVTIEVFIDGEQVDESRISCDDLGCWEVTVGSLLPKRSIKTCLPDNKNRMPQTIAVVLARASGCEVSGELENKKWSK